MHKSATKYNETLGKWCKNKHGASKIIDTFEAYHPSSCSLEDLEVYWGYLELSSSSKKNSSCGFLPVA
jgi:hypothetical protein